MAAFARISAVPVFGNAQKVEKWQAEWYSWTTYRAFDNEPTAEEKLLRAIFGESDAEEAHAQQEDHPGIPEEHGRDYGYRNSGPELLERCERHMKHLTQPEGYAYDTVPFRAAPAEAALGTPTTILSQPTLPQAALQPDEPLILPGREQALTLLKEDGEPFTAALGSLASTADDAAVAALFEQYAALRAREGFDDMRYHRLNNLALALLATQCEDVIEAVLQKELDTKFWGMPPPIACRESCSREALNRCSGTRRIPGTSERTKRCRRPLHAFGHQ